MYRDLQASFPCSKAPTRSQPSLSSVAPVVLAFLASLGAAVAAAAPDQDWIISGLRPVAGRMHCLHCQQTADQDHQKMLQTPSQCFWLFRKPAVFSNRAFVLSDMTMGMVYIYVILLDARRKSSHPEHKSTDLLYPSKQGLHD